MPHAAAVRPDEDDEPAEAEDEEDEDDEEGEAPPSRRRSRSPPRRRRRSQRPAPVRRWRASDDDEEEEEEEEPPPRHGRYALPPPTRKPIYWRARDSLWFEPLVALAIIVILLVALFAYTQNWPPIYVVESNSMQHGSGDQVGLINAGDLVLAQKVSSSSIVPYMTGLQTGYSTYGEHGDVILYWANGQGPTPIIHRAILYLQYNTAGGGSYNATELGGLPCGTGPNADYSYRAPNSTLECGAPVDLSPQGNLTLYRVGWESRNISIDPLGVVGRQSGFLTMGDNNSRPDQLPPAPISSLVEAGWIIGVARGMIPWFGSLKLLLDGNAGLVPAQSWEYMGLTIVAIILVAFAIHYAFRTEGIETPVRREEEEEARAQAEAEAAAMGESAPRRWLSHLRRRHPEDEEDEGATEETAPRRRTRPPPSSASSKGASSRRGRPAPHVRRSEKAAKKRPRDDDGDDEL